MKYADAVAHLYALGPELAPVRAEAGAPLSSPLPLRKFDLAYTRALCAALGDPQRSVPSILIAGTNGKGSTAATLASILTTAGYRTGLYTSPHLIRVNERIQLARPVLPTEYGTSSVYGTDGPLTLCEIPDDEFARLYTLVDEASEQLVSAGRLPAPASFFERLTALAFLYFAGSESNARAEIMVLEVGLGGRLDATNVVDPLLSILTDISLDHQEYLGDTIAEIAAEKCGILRELGTLITLSQHPAANEAIGVAATRLGVRAINAAAYLPSASRNVPNAAVGAFHASVEEATPIALSRNAYSVTLEDSGSHTELQVRSPLTGQHQQRNLALAIAAAVDLRNQNGYNLTNAAIEAGIVNTRWPGRLEWIAPNLLLDVAHNPAGAWTLRAALASLPPGQPRTLLFSCLRDKDLAEMSRILFPLFDSSPGGDPDRSQDHIVLAPIDNPRAAAVGDLVAAAAVLGVPAHVAPHLAAALMQAREITPPNGIIVATGSVYMVGEIRRLAVQEEV